MKRYRCTNFFIDCIRNYPVESEIKSVITSRYGDLDIEQKIKRYLSFRPPSLRIITEYHNLLQEIEDSYIYGLYYSTVTSSCCLGERIFNILILKLKNYYKESECYKHIYAKESFDNWDKSIKMLWDWKVITSEDAMIKYKKLTAIRHGFIHFSKLEDIEQKALETLRIIYDITTYFFAIGYRQDIYFWCSGEIYIKKEAEQIPFVREMILPHCLLAGYKHKIETVNNGFVMRDESTYDEKEISDEEFVKLRTTVKI